MTYLENAIRRQLKEGRYYLVRKTVEEIASEIDRKNDENPSEFYTIRDWIKDDLASNQPHIVKQEVILCKALSHLAYQEQQCFDQTGCLPCAEDYVLECQSETFKNAIGFDISFEGLFRLLCREYARRCEE